MALFQRLAALAESSIGVGALVLEPHALHLAQIVERGRVLARELGGYLLGLLDHVGAQHVLAALVVDEAVGGVERLGLVQPAHGLVVVARVLVDLALDHVELDQSGRVVDGLVDVVESRLGVANVVAVLGQIVVDPEESGRRLLLLVASVARVEAATLGQMARVAGNQLANARQLGRVGVQVLELLVERRHALVQSATHVGVDGRAELVAAEKLERQAARHVRARILVAVLAIEGHARLHAAQLEALLEAPIVGHVLRIALDEALVHLARLVQLFRLKVRVG